MSAYPEVVIGAYIFNGKGELLLIKSPKWHNDWMPPGGHIEYGERIRDCATREVLEETGLKVKPIGVISIGEGIFPKEYKSKRHFVYVEVFCKALTNNVKMDNEEVVDFKWLKPESALKKTKNKSVKRVIKIYLKKKRDGMDLLFV